MSEDSPKLVSLETSLELSEFLSEADFPSESSFPSEAEARSQAGSPPALSGTGSPSPDDPRVEPTSYGSAPEDVPAATAAVIANEDAPEARVPAGAHVGPATVTEFPVRPQTHAAVALPSLPPGPVTLVELIERRGGFDWREAVAVIHQICLYLRDHSPHGPTILLDPRNIQITDNGEVQLLSGQTSSDPLVIQVGRLLRTMLMGNEAPPELRLLLAQATFELPIFESIEDVDRALAQLNKLDEPGPAGLALLRAVAAPPPPPSPDYDVANRPPAIRSILPAHRAMPRRSRPRGTRFGSLFGSHASHVALTCAAIAVVGGLLLTRPAVLFPSNAPTAAAQPAPIVIATVPPEVPTPAAPAAPVPSEEAAPPQLVQPPPTVARSHTGVVVATPLESRSARDPSRPAGSNAPRPAATAGVVLTPPAPRTPLPPPPSPRDSERRATSLLAQGQTVEASMAFDALVLSNPLYEPRTTELTPEALAAFRTSQRLLLPAITQRNYDRAKTALAAGDADRALALAKETTTILDRRLADTPPQLREQVEDLAEQAKVAAAAANEIIYSEADVDVVPPRPLSRQMPVTGPIGVPPNRVGWLDMVIDRDGSVFFVKLTTPLNRHHERMIVSPAKAWLYRPATKNGRPVMYRIRVKVNLPESGTDF